MNTIGELIKRAGRLELDDVRLQETANNLVHPKIVNKVKQNAVKYR